MDEVVAADGETVAVAADLPHIEFGIGDLAAGGDGCGTTVDGVHAVGGHVVGQTAAAPDAADDGDVLWCGTYFSQGFVEVGQEEVVATAGTPAGLTLLII